MAAKSGKQGDRFPWESWGGVIATMGLASILIVIIGRLWTTTYFNHFGLPSSGMEFSIYDFAFRSLEALISLLLGAIALGLAWLNRERLKAWGFTSAVIELVLIIVLIVWVRFLLPMLPNSWLATTGVLGLSNGLTLAAMLWFSVDVLEGPGGGYDNWPKRLKDPFGWLLKRLLKPRPGDLIVLAGLLFAGLLAAWVFVGLPRLPDSWLAKAGILGLSSGLALVAMVWFGVDAWAWLSGSVKNWPNWLRNLVHWLLKKSWPNWLRKLVHWLLKMLRQGEPDTESVVSYGWRVVAAGFVLAIGFAYLPLVSQRLAAMEATADVATGKFAAAILEAKDPLPEAIASSADPTRSNPVRVILTQSQNTYVLHSTTCTTIGELKVPIRRGGFLPPEAPDVCRVFTIPTERLRSIEYFQVRGKAPSNESLLHPLEVGLGDEPFEESFCSDGASDEEELECGEGIRFFNSIWFEFAPATNGAVLARVETAEFTPVIGIWQTPQGATDVQPVAGSADDGSACEIEKATIVVEDQTKNVVGVVANIQAGTRYVVSVGAQEDGGGLGRVSFEFTPGGYFFSPAITEAQAQLPEDETTPEPGPAALGVVKAPEAKALVAQVEVPQVEIVSGVGSAKLELWRLAPETYYELQPLAEMPQDVRDDFLPGEFTLESEGKEPKSFQKKNEGEEQPTALYAVGLTEGVWKLVAPEDFAGLTKLTGTSRAPDLMLAFADTSGTPLRNGEVQQAVLVVLEESGIREELGYGGDVIFDPESFAEGLQIPPVVEDCEVGARLLLEGAGYKEGFPIQIRVEWESETLDAAAEIVQQRLLAIGLDARIEPCTDACIRVFFRTGD